MPVTFQQAQGLITALPQVARTGVYSDLTGRPALGTAAALNVEAFAGAAQGAKADTAVQPADLAPVATSGIYGDLVGVPVLGTAASTDATACIPWMLFVKNKASTSAKSSTRKGCSTS